ncbi:MAG: HAMP domain-containing histidine kinase, partial [Lachnospiraceae bacterium]|nr:HAMP domain-containing histidine kinase [Lachnospiraceae bacterium]
MNHAIKEIEKERHKVAAVYVVISFTIAGLGLLAETILLGWEPWAIPLVASMICALWIIHIKRYFIVQNRTYVYGILFLTGAFFHGIHKTSLYDISLIMCLIFFVFSMLEETVIIDFGIIIYLFLMGYQVFVLHNEAEFNSMFELSKIILHIVVVALIAYGAKITIRSRKKVNQGFEKTIEDMSSVNRQMEDFMVNVSHELRTPINVVTGLSMVLMDHEINDEKKNELYEIYVAGKRLSGQVENLLDHSELDTDRLILDKEVYNITSIFNDVTQEIKVFFGNRKRNVDIVINLDPSIPYKLVGDQRRIKKVLRHLIDNGVKFTEHGGVMVHVYHEPRPYGINLCMDVVDTGKGLSAEDKERLFSGAYKLDSGRAKATAGTGMGISLIYGFVHKMG